MLCCARQGMGVIQKERSSIKNLCALEVVKVLSMGMGIGSNTTQPAASSGNRSTAPTPSNTIMTNFKIQAGL